MGLRGPANSVAVEEVARLLSETSLPLHPVCCPNSLSEQVTLAQCFAFAAERRTFEIAGRAKQQADRTGTGRQPSLKDRMPSTSLPPKPGSVEPPTAPSGSLLARLGPSHGACSLSPFTSSAIQPLTPACWEIGDSRPGSPDVAPKRARSRSPGPGHGYGPRNGPLPPQDESGAPAPPRKFRRHGGRRSRR